MRSLRFVAAMALGLTPLLGSLAAGTAPAFAGGGAGMTLTATMEGQDQRLLAGTKHLVTITVADTPGEADLRDVWVGLDDLDPHPLTVTCPAGVNGQLSLEPEQSLQCTAVVTAEVGFRTLVARARARVPGGGSLVRSAPLHYTGFLPPPPPPPPAPVVHPALKAPLKPEPAAAPAHPVLAEPGPAPSAAAPADPPSGGAKTDPADPPAAADPAGPADPGGSGHAADPPATACPEGKSGGAGASAGAANGCCAGGKASSSTGSGCCDSHVSGTDCAKTALASVGGGRKGGGLLAFTGMTTTMLATVAGVGTVLLTGGALLVRRSSRR